MAKKNRSGTSAGTNHNTPQAGTKEAAAVPRGDSQLVNAITMWESEAASTGLQTVSTIRLDESERLLVLFTTSSARVSLHYLGSEVLPGYVHCLGPDCLLCRIGRTVELRDLIPTYDLTEHTVGVLSVSSSLRPHALRPQLLPLLKRVGSDEEPFLTMIRKNGMGNFIVTTAPLHDGADDGATIIAQFQKGVDEGSLDLSSAFQRTDNSVLKEIPEVATAMKAKGIDLCSSNPFNE